MKEIVLASNNRNKISELETLLRGYMSNAPVIKSLREIGYSDEIEENGSTFEENSLIKASALAKLGYITIADDSGLSVDCLNGAPGIFSARYSGEHGDDAANRRKLLGDMAGVHGEMRGAEFVCLVSLVLPENCAIIIPEEWQIDTNTAGKIGIPRERAMTVRGVCRGMILNEERGCGGFGYDSLFYYPAFGMTFAEISNDQKNKVSHRGVAMREFALRLNKIFKD